MKKYQIVLESEDVANASSKAPSDIRKIANDLNFKELVIKLKFDSSSYISKLKTQVEYRNKWKSIYDIVEPKFYYINSVPYLYSSTGKK